MLKNDQYLYFDYEYFKVDLSQPSLICGEQSPYLYVRAFDRGFFSLLLSFAICPWIINRGL
jgi:hypothetical protein